MNYYEELGVRPDATAEEIRQAYRSLARLLHPDQQAAEPLRRLAEDRMKRLNSAYQTLADSNRRRQYDTALVRLPAAHSRPARLRARDGLAFAAGLAAAILLWRLTSPPAQTRTAPTAPETPHSDSLPQRRAAAKRTPRPAALPALPSTESAPLVSLSGVRTDDPPLLPPRESQPFIAGYAGSAIQGPPPPALLRSSPVVPLVGFGGTWIYVPPRTATQEKALYPAEYVEAVIVEDGETLRGRYRARYQVPDLPISPEVAFRFEGKAHGDTVNLTWTGASGAEGELKLKLVSNNTLRADWIATAFGAQLGLASGTSLLTRRLDP